MVGDRLSLLHDAVDCCLAARGRDDLQLPALTDSQVLLEDLVLVIFLRRSLALEDPTLEQPSIFGHQEAVGLP